MTPAGGAVLADLAQRLAGEVMPRMASPYLKGEVGLSAALLAMMAEAWDREAHRLVEENAAIVAIFTNAGGLLAGAALGERLGTLAGGAEDDLHLSALERRNHVLRAALVDLHAWAESRPDAAAKALNEEIWSELVASTERRRLAFDPF